MMGICIRIGKIGVYMRANAAKSKSHLPGETTLLAKILGAARRRGGGGEISGQTRGS